MAVTPFNISQGPGQLFVAPFGTSVAAYLGSNPGSVPVAGPFVDAGGTTGGITVEVDETLSDIHVDQLLEPVGARITARTIQVTTTIMETEQSNLLTTLNQAATVTTGTGWSELDLTTTTSATQPTYCVLIVDGWAPTLSGGGAAKRRFIVQKALSQPKISLKYDMANQATVAVTFTAYYVSSSTSPFSIVDQTAL
jgi:hypothetical protein